MAETTEVLIASFWGRGLALSERLRERGYGVRLVDFTPKDLRSHSRDVDGPFPLWLSSDEPEILRAYGAWGKTSLQHEGACVWVEDGPVYLHSPTTDHRLAQLGMSELVKDYLYGERGSKVLKRLRQAPFAETWLTGFSAQLSSQNYCENYAAFEHLEMQGVSAHPLWLRDASQAGGELAKLHVERATEMRLKAHKQGTEIDGGELAQAVVWTLTPAETWQIFPEAAGQIFPRLPTVPDWTWLRWNFTVAEGESLVAALPSWLVHVPDVYLPWSENYLQIVRKISPKELDVWVRVRTLDAENAEASRRIAAQVELSLGTRLPNVQLRWRPVGWKQEHHWKLFGLCSEPRAFVARSLGRNWFFSSPAVHGGWDPMSQFRHELSLLTQLDPLKRKWEAIKARARAKAQRAAERAARMAEKGTPP